jgi:hypothetical protein
MQTSLQEWYVTGNKSPIFSVFTKFNFSTVRTIVTGGSRDVQRSICTRSKECVLNSLVTMSLRKVVPQIIKSWSQIRLSIIIYYICRAREKIYNTVVPANFEILNVSIETILFFWSNLGVTFSCVLILLIFFTLSHYNQMKFP